MIFLLKKVPADLSSLIKQSWSWSSYIIAVVTKLFLAYFYYTHTASLSRITIHFCNFQLLRVSLKAALLSICTQSRSTGGLPVKNCLFQQMSHMLLCNLVNKTTIPKTINNPHVVHLDLLGWNWSVATSVRLHCVSTPAGRNTLPVRGNYLGTTPAFLHAGQFCSSSTPF